jgi:hypothetical protein
MISAQLWFLVSILSFMAAPVYAFASDFEWYGCAVLLTITAGAFVLGALAVGIDDGAIAPTPDATLRAPVPRRNLPAPWPALTAVAIGAVLIGWAGSGLVFYAGLVLAAIILLEWMVQSWAERATDDDDTNRALRHRLMLPLEVPITAALGIALVILSFSRFLLSLTATGATVAAIVVASLVLAVGALLSFKPGVSSSLLTALVAGAALVFLAGGVIGIVVGEHEVEKHGEQHPEDPGADESNNPADDEGGENQSDPGPDPGANQGGGVDE